MLEIEVTGDHSAGSNRQQRLCAGALRCKRYNMLSISTKPLSASAGSIQVESKIEFDLTQ